MKTLKLSLILLVVSFIGLALQATVVHTVMPRSIAPDILVIVAVYLGLMLPRPQGVLLAFVLGLCGDFASGQFLGPQAGGLVVAFAVTVLGSGKLFAENSLALGLLTLVASVGKSAFLLGMLAIYLGSSHFGLSSLQSMLVEAVLSAIFAPLVFRVISFFAQSKRDFSPRPRVEWSSGL